jgi:hypothetical protein
VKIRDGEDCRGHASEGGPVFVIDPVCGVIATDLPPDERPTQPTPFRPKWSGWGSGTDCHGRGTVHANGTPSFADLMSASHHLRVQITLLATAAGGRKSPLPAEFRTVFVAPGERHFPGVFFPSGLTLPGGAAVNGEVLFDLPEAVSYFPAGIQFDVWEAGRKGYGTVLAVLG